MEYGTPQGSCLGPLLFLIFTNDLHQHLKYCQCILFADDTTIYMSHRNLNYCEWCIQSDIHTLQDWFKANKLMLNIKKICMHAFLSEKVQGNKDCHRQYPTTRGNENKISWHLDRQSIIMAVSLRSIMSQNYKKYTTTKSQQKSLKHSNQKNPVLFTCLQSLGIRLHHLGKHVKTRAIRKTSETPELLYKPGE